MSGGSVRGEEEPEENPDEAGPALDVEHGFPAQPVEEQARHEEAHDSAHLGARHDHRGHQRSLRLRRPTRQHRGHAGECPGLAAAHQKPDNKLR